MRYEGGVISNSTWMSLRVLALLRMQRLSRNFSEENKKYPDRPDANRWTSTFVEQHVRLSEH